MNSLNRANICAGATISAKIRIYHINIAFRNSLNRAFIDATATCSTIIINYVSHNVMNLVVNYAANIDIMFF